ncbi:MAG: hypothetical protein EZS28_056395, partial [Streblomastix strix]
AESAAWKDIQRGLIEEIDPAYDWAGASDEKMKMRSQELWIKYINQYAPAAIAQARRKQAGRMEVD